MWTADMSPLPYINVCRLREKWRESGGEREREEGEFKQFNFSHFLFLRDLFRTRNSIMVPAKLTSDARNILTYPKSTKPPP